MDLDLQQDFLDRTGTWILLLTFKGVQDEISTGLDSSTTFQIVRSLRDFVQLGSATALIALLQPAPEVFVSFSCTCEQYWSTPSK